MPLANNFKYPELMRYFETVSSIPRGTYNEKAIADHLVRFAEERGLEYYRDSFNNVLIKKKATKGKADRAPLALQGHTDMVCEKNSDVEHDFLRDPIKLYEENGWIRARGTTLGADNGVAVAVMLCLLDGGACEHPPLECLFTASEEVGLDGAKNFDYSRLTARRMINMDSADERLITAGCAGGVRTCISLEIGGEPIRNGYKALGISVGGLFGGHSGEDIGRSRANAIKLLGRVLAYMRKRFSVQLLSLNGGSKDNAIPREACATVAIPCECANDFEKELFMLEATVRAELAECDRGFFIKIKEEAANGNAICSNDTDKVLFLINTAQNGVIAQNTFVEGIVDTSRNLGLVRTEGEHITCTFLSRSSLESHIDLLVSELDTWGDMLGASVTHFNRYPGWSFAASSDIRRAYISAYEELFGSTPEVTVIHAGLECGIISKAVPDMDIVSCGPVVTDLHSPDEAMDKASFERFFTVIKKIVETA